MDQKIVYSKMPPYAELSQRVFERVQNAPGKIPLWQATADEALKITRNPLADMNLIARVIAKDPALYAKFLGLVNSPLYSRGKSVTDLGVALLRLGLQQTKNLLLQSVAYSEIFKSKRFGQEIRYSLLHGMSLALLSREVAPKFKVNQEVLFAFCMLHDIGYSIAIKNIEQLSPDAAKETVLKAADHRHGELAAIVLAAQGVPPEIWHIIHKHASPKARFNLDERRLMKVFHLLNGLLLLNPSYPTHLRGLVGNQQLALKSAQESDLPSELLERLEEWIPNMLTIVNNWCTA